MSGTAYAAPINGNTTRYCHRMVKVTAMALAHEVYDRAMGDNAAWANWRQFCEDLGRQQTEEEFVALAWPHLLDTARATLAKLLGSSMDEGLKEQIHDALIKDNLIRGTADLKPLSFVEPH